MPHIPLNSLAIDGLPSAENEAFEYKSSKTPLPKLREKISIAASAFANSGGGCFIAGVAGDGTPDGGLPSRVGRQNLRDWVDLAIATVSPVVSYEIQQFDDSHGKGQLDAGKVILVISFPASSSAPHMADNHVYYIRAGAHSLPAPSFIVESLWAHRVSTKPLLSHAVRERPGSPHVIQVGVVALNPAPAIDVEFNIGPLPKSFGNLEKYFPLRLPIVDRDTPFFLDITEAFMWERDLREDVTVTIAYRDLAGNQYVHRSERPLRQAVAPILLTPGPAERVVKAIENLANRLDRRTPY